ncbi:hypothetical protein [Pseudomonas sp. N040]|uniref:hypothetical protein n=1 Tax=Pseudomonas sp. N040 TaxID=2785325 RepID=UPI0018A2AA58|nr:hypothetical protein [Pseudomonas sp. N040]MBF7731615.1 hypothetical protein [Pseudomonas sp. N040]MBW7015259.1 hypothetical protein [Pseudomonas sp. N040]
MPGLALPGASDRASQQRQSAAEMNRRCWLVALSLLLAACGDEQSPEPVPVPVPKSAPTAVPVVPQVPPVTVAQPAAVTPATVSREIKVEPLPRLPPAPVDLSLPPQLIDELTAGDSPASVPQAESLLPPLFVEKPKPESSFQLNGRLLTNDQLSEDYLESVEGAEIRLQYKH